MTAEEQWQHMWELQQLPRTPGTATGPGWRTPMTPRTTAFTTLQGGKPEPKYVQHSSPIQEQDEWVHGGKQGQGVQGQGVQGQDYYPSPVQEYYPSPVQEFYPSPVHANGQNDWVYDSKGKGTAV